jgi:hypothetical protein
MGAHTYIVKWILKTRTWKDKKGNRWATTRDREFFSQSAAHAHAVKMSYRGHRVSLSRVSVICGISMAVQYTTEELAAVLRGPNDGTVPGGAYLGTMAQVGDRVPKAQGDGMTLNAIDRIVVRRCDGGWRVAEMCGVDGGGSLMWWRGIFETREAAWDHVYVQFGYKRRGEP